MAALGLLSICHMSRKLRLGNVNCHVDPLDYGQFVTRHSKNLVRSRHGSTLVDPSIYISWQHGSVFFYERSVVRFHNCSSSLFVRVLYFCDSSSF